MSAFDRKPWWTQLCPKCTYLAGKGKWSLPKSCVHCWRINEKTQGR